MKRIILDSNVYGLIIEDKERDKIVLSISASHSFIIYGLNVVRKELRMAPKFCGEKRIRLDLLQTYDKFVKNHSVPLTKEAEALAEKYYALYKKLGGNLSRAEMHNDLLIVASASLNNLDVVASEDNRSMLSVSARRAYDLVNAIEKKRTPEFIGYKEFKWWLL